MDILDEEYEIHADVSRVEDQTAYWKPFKIEKCVKCGKSPSVVRNFDVTGKGRYTIKCCGPILVRTDTETKAIYEWNLLQSLDRKEI